MQTPTHPRPSPASCIFASLACFNLCTSASYTHPQPAKQQQRADEARHISSHLPQHTILPSLASQPLPCLFVPSAMRPAASCGMCCAGMACAGMAVLQANVRNYYMQFTDMHGNELGGPPGSAAAAGIDERQPDLAHFRANQMRERERRDPGPRGPPPFMGGPMGGPPRGRCAYCLVSATAGSVVK